MSGAPRGVPERPSGVRLDRAEIDARILDLTAGLLARHGTTATSISMIAAAAGYSKAAILRRFGDKSQLIAATVHYCNGLGARLVEDLADVPTGPIHTEAVVEGLTRSGFEHPGFIALALASLTIREKGEFGGRLNPLGDALRALFRLPPVERDRDDPAPVLRSIGTIGVVAVLTLFTRDLVEPSDIGPVIRAIATSTLEPAAVGEQPPTDDAWRSGHGS